MRKLYPLVLVIFCACSLIKKKSIDCHQYPFQHLDSIHASVIPLNYLIEVPVKWKEVRTTNQGWYWVENDSNTENNYSAELFVDQSIIREDCQQSTTIKSYLEFYLNWKNRLLTGSQGFKYVLLKSNHKLYEDMFIVKYKERTKSGSILSKADFLILNGRKGYLISYQARPSLFDIYLKDVQLMINSIRFLE